MKAIRTIIAAVLLAAPLSIFAQKYVGGDISLLTKYETNGATYLDNKGDTIHNMLSYMKEQGLNAMRVRLFVDPSNATATAKGEGVCQDLDYVVALAKRIKAAGLSLMLDFHYSDTWADPAKQWTPAAWASMTDTELETEMYNYTKDALQKLVEADATPDFIQTGNEISYGMLWGTSTTASSSLKKCYVGNSDNWDRFALLLQNATKACREICPKAKIIIHTERVEKPSVLTGFYDNMKTYGVDYDIIGLSYYPYFHGPLTTISSVLTTLEGRFPTKNIMIVETGYYHKWQADDVDYDLSATYPISEDGQKAFTDALIDTLNNHKNVTGLYWWWPEANEYKLDWNTKRVTDGWYNCGLWDNETGKALAAFYELKKFITTTGISEIKADKQVDNSWYTLSGSRTNEPAQRGIYIHQGKKIIRQ